MTSEQTSEQQTTTALADQADALAEVLRATAADLRASSAPESVDRARRNLRIIQVMLRAWGDLTNGHVRHGARAGQDAGDARGDAAGDDRGDAAGDADSAAGGAVRDGRRLVGTSPDGIDLTTLAPAAERWLAARRAALALQVLENLPPAEQQQVEEVGKRMMALLLARGIMVPILSLARHALNRTPTLALRMEERRAKEGLTVAAAAEAIGIGVEEYARYARSGRGLTPEQRALVAVWVDATGADDARRDRRRSGETLHAAMPLGEFAARAGLEPAAVPAAIEAFVQTELPVFYRAGLLDGIRITRLRGGDDQTQIVNVWVPPDQRATRFFTGGWVRYALAAHLRACDPEVNVLIDPVFHTRAEAPEVFSPAIVAVRAGSALVVNPLTGRSPEQYARSLRRLRDLASLLVDGDPRRMIVVLAAPDHGFDAPSMERLGATFGVTVTDLDGAVAALDAALALLPPA